MSGTMMSRTLSVRIERPWDKVYGYLSDPANFANWASGLGQLRHDGESWQTDTPAGTMRVRFTAPNAHGILDHTVIPPDGTEIHIPMRAIANGGGAEVLFTLFRQPDMDDERFAADARWVEEDLARLKAALEA